MPKVLRWGRSSYERDEDMARERLGSEALGFSWSLSPDPRVAPAGLEEADVLVVTSKARVTGEILTRFGGREVITTTSGYDHVDLSACERAGVRLSRSPMARRDAVVEVSLGSLVALMRRVPDQVEAARQGRWVRASLPELAPRGLAGSVVVVVGTGVIGTRMAECLGLLGAQVRRVGRVQTPGTVPIDEALEGADAVTLHCSLTPSSRGLLDAARLSRLPDHAVVVNTARGEVLDLPAAVGLVQAGRLRGLATDVFPVEPYPRLAEATAPGVWFTPHAAGFTHDLGSRVAASVLDVLEALQRGQRPPYVVTSGAA